MSDTLQQEPIIATIASESAEAESIEAAPAYPVAQPSALEERLARLERRISELQNTEALETRIAARVLERVIPPEETPRWYDRFNPFRGAANIPQPSGWLMFDLFNDVRFTLVMFLDRKFAMTWTSRGLVILTIALAFTWSIWLSPIALIPLLGSTLVGVLTTILTLLCGGLLFKVLHRETHRYRLYRETHSK